MEINNLIEKIKPAQVPDVSRIETKPMAPEKRAEASEAWLEEGQSTKEKARPTQSASNIVSISNAQQQIKEEIKTIEKVLEKDLGSIYLNMSPDKQREFRIKGEETAKQINILLHKTKIQIKKIVDLIRKWLSIIPGVNKFFLEQEAKIRADEIVKLKRGL